MPYIIGSFNNYKYCNHSDLESTTNGLTPPPAPFQLGNTSFLSQETSLERQGLYSQLVNSYKWIDKVHLTLDSIISYVTNLHAVFGVLQIHEYSQLANQVLSANVLKRSYITNSNKRRRPLTSSHNVPPQYLIYNLSSPFVQYHNIYIYTICQGRRQHPQYNRPQSERHDH